MRLVWIVLAVSKIGTRDGCLAVSMGDGIVWDERDWDAIFVGFCFSVGVS